MIPDTLKSEFLSADFFTTSLNNLELFGVNVKRAKIG